ncbi:DUF6328 family protein [Pseudonocardia sp. Cha107L01]|uniref:DUF6328 family protein n=1 Tax=Pseudonocardia sp. Cha107L01 TaxID=3457576 RepID=UPI00403E7351
MEDPERAIEWAVRCDDGWNTQQRDEAPLQRADRNFAELLQELRVAQTGGQILFGFLLALSFTDRFAGIDAFQRAVYLFTLLASAVTTMLLVAPAAAHRLMFQYGRKRELVRLGHRLLVSGLAGLAVTMTAGILLVVDVSVGRAAAVVAAGLLLLSFSMLWFVVPLRARQVARKTVVQPFVTPGAALPRDLKRHLQPTRYDEPRCNSCSRSPWVSAKRFDNRRPSTSHLGGAQFPTLLESAAGQWHR